jgi:hypothetical protein
LCGPVQPANLLLCRWRLVALTWLAQAIFPPEKLVQPIWRALLPLGYVCLFIIGLIAKSLFPRYL